jgi:hypothetical protein
MIDLLLAKIRSKTPDWRVEGNAFATRPFNRLGGIGYFGGVESMPTISV